MSTTATANKKPTAAQFARAAENGRQPSEAVRVAATSLIGTVRARSDDAVTAAAELQRAIDANADGLAPQRQVQLEARLDDVARLEQLSRSLEARIRVTSEPLTYRQDVRHSYVRDLVMSRVPGQDPDEGGAERLARHRKEMDTIGREANGGQESRANMNRTDGTGGDFVPPLWLMDKYVGLARAGRVTADLCQREPLPSGTDRVTLPAVLTGAATAEQTDGASVQKTDMTTGNVAAGVTTIAGQQVFSLQLLEQSPNSIDAAVFGDMLADLATKVDQYVISKAAIGILNITGINAVTYTDASPTVPELYPKIADSIQRIATTRFLPAQAHVMTPARWAWMLSALDANNRPLVVPNAQGPANAFAGMTDVRAEGAVGTLHGLPVYIDPNIPSNLGAGTNEDRIITARFDDLWLFEGELRTRTLFETDADTLSVRLQVWEYLAFLGQRYPKSISVLGGTGLVQPTF